MKVFSVAQIRKWDEYTICHEPIDSIDLMERAAFACYQWLQSNFTKTNTYTVFCGNGNNGGDGLAIARMLLLAGNKVKVIVFEGKNRTPDCTINLERIQMISNDINYINEFTPMDLEIDGVVIDALLGAGLSHPLTGKLAEIVTAINQKGKQVVSIDIPTGLFADEVSMGPTIIQAHYTLSFQTVKLAFLMADNNQFVGQIHLVDIGLHQRYYDQTAATFTIIDQQEISLIYKPRKQFTHKYNFGHSLLFAGSKNMMGAALLCAKACLRTGAGLVTLHTDEMAQSMVQIALPEAISTTENNLQVLSRKKAAVGIGPGLEMSTFNQQLLEDLVEKGDIPLVIDATALHLLSRGNAILSKRFKSTTILTPHSGEFEVLFGKTSNDFERTQLALQKSIALNCYIILKGHHSLVACVEGNAFFNSTGNAGMATAGSGDVLTGIITGLLSQGYSAKNACLLGVYLHGLAGDIASKKMSQESMIASDIIDSMGEAFISIHNCMIQ